jgi:hypothetical protein
MNEYVICDRNKYVSYRALVGSNLSSEIVCVIIRYYKSTPLHQENSHRLQDHAFVPRSNQPC